MQQEIDFDNFKVKLITDYFELADAEAMLSRYHPLGVRKAIGSRLWYSVSCRGEWMAILLFDGAVKRNRRREMHIGWSEAQRSGRLVHIANNSRYLLSPQYADTKDLASKIF
jgi:hypothetical protein